MNQLHSNSHANSRLSSSKPILGGGVAGSKYVVRNREMNYNGNGAESKPSDNFDFVRRHDVFAIALQPV